MNDDTITILAVTVLGAAFFLERAFSRRRRPLKLNKRGLAPCHAYAWGETEVEAVSAWNRRAS